MLFQSQEDRLATGGKLFEVGGEVFANLNSDYMGLFGRVTEIRYKGDQDTPDLCCSFDPQQATEGPYTREQYVSGKWRRLKGPKRSEPGGAVMKPEMLEPIPDSLPQSAGTVYALSYYSDSDDGCTSGTLAVSPDVGVLLRGMLDDLETQGARGHPDPCGRDGNQLFLYLRGQGNRCGRSVPQLYHRAGGLPSCDERGIGGVSIGLRDKMLAVMADLNREVVEREELIEAISIALLTRKNLFILGDPG